MAFEAGRLLGEYQQYQIIEAVAESGAIGAHFYRAYDLDRQTTVGIYEIYESLCPQLEAAPLRETLKRATALTDPNLIRILDYEIENEYYLVTEWVDGISLVTLMERIRQQTLLPTPLDMIEIAQQIGCALESLLLNGEDPRIANPRTIMVTYSNLRGNGNTFRAVLTDLGISALVDQTTMRGQYQAEDLAYLAPEYFTNQQKQTAGEGQDYPAALYALGQVLYWLLTDKPAVAIASWEEGVSHWKTIEAWRPAPLRASLPLVPVALERVILTALAAPPEQRFDRPGAMVAALARASTTLQGIKSVNADFSPVGLVDYLRESSAEALTDAGRFSILTIAKNQLVIEAGVGDETEIRIHNLNPERAERFRLRVEEPTNIIKSAWITIITKQLGLANYQEDAHFTLLVQPPTGVFIPAGNYTLNVKVFSSIHAWQVIDEQTITVVVKRVAHGVVDAIWPQELDAGMLTQLIIRNLGNFRESFRIDLRSDNNLLVFEPAHIAAVVDPGQTEMVPFRPFPRRRPWFGRAQKVKLTAQVAMQQTGKLELAAAQVKVHSLFPPLVLLLTFLGLLLFSLVGLWLARPSITPKIILLHNPGNDADPCDQLLRIKAENGNDNGCLLLSDQGIERPTLIVGWDLASSNSFADNYWFPVLNLLSGAPTGSRARTRTIGNHVKSIGLQLYPQQQLLIPITQTIGAKVNNRTITSLTHDLADAELMLYMYKDFSNLNLINNPQLVVRNRLGEQSWLGPLSWLGARAYPIFYTQLVPKAEVKIERFCVAPDDRLEQQDCSTKAATTRLALYATSIQALFFRWKIPSLTEHHRLLLKTLDETIEITGDPVHLPAPVAVGDYQYTLVLMDENDQTIDEASLMVTVREISCKLNLNAINTVEGLALQKSPGDTYETLGRLLPDQPMTIILRSQPADYAQNQDEKQWVQVVIKETQESGWLAFNGLDCPSFAPPTADGLPTAHSANGLTRTTQLDPPIANGVAVAPEQNPAIAQLPIVKPEFSATTTPTPEPTPAPTLEPAPTATPEPLVVDISADKVFVGPNDCITLKWTITGVKAVYFGRSDYNDSFADMVGISNNVNHVEEICELEETVTFTWRIVIETEPQLIDTIHHKTVNYVP